MGSDQVIRLTADLEARDRARLLYLTLWHTAWEICLCAVVMSLTYPQRVDVFLVYMRRSDELGSLDNRTFLLIV